MTLFVNFLLTALVLLTIRCASSGSFDCTNFDSNMGAKFDLRDLQRTTGQPSYRVEDGDLPCTKYVEQNYTYVFNICGAVQDGIPEKCDDLPGLNTAAALQVNTRGTVAEGDDWCFKVGAYDDKKSKLTLLDQKDPTKGVALTYYGDYCRAKEGQTPIQRTFKIELPCSDRLNPVPTHAYETTACGYTVYLPSVYGCPIECPVAQRQLCGGNGHCSYDYDKRAARCFCNHGYGGADCTSSDAVVLAPSSYSPALTGLIITLFVIIGVLVASVTIMIKQVSAYRDDVSNYQVLKGGDEDEKTVGI